VLRKTPPGRGGEIQLTDALRILAERGLDTDGGGVHGVLFRGRRYDTGNKLDYLKTQIKFACERPDIKGDFVPWLRSYLEELSRDSGGVVPRGQQSGAAP
jgi:UTP--glucose-1-phosphate uridylyltransferase